MLGVGQLLGWEGVRALRCPTCCSKWPPLHRQGLPVSLRGESSGALHLWESRSLSLLLPLSGERHCFCGPANCCGAPERGSYLEEVVTEASAGARVSECGGPQGRFPHSACASETGLRPPALPFLGSPAGELSQTGGGRRPECVSPQSEGMARTYVIVHWGAVIEPADLHAVDKKLCAVFLEGEPYSILGLHSVRGQKRSLKHPSKKVIFSI